MTASAMAVYARWCGATLARVHARSGDRIAIASYLLTSDVFDKAIADFSAAHADQNEREYQTLRDAVRSGRITAQTGLEPEADSIANARHLAPAAANHVPKKTPSTSMNRPGVSGDSEPWEGWSHARRYAQAVPA